MRSRLEGDVTSDPKCFDWSQLCFESSSTSANESADHRVEVGMTGSISWAQNDNDLKDLAGSESNRRIRGKKRSFSGSKWNNGLGLHVSGMGLKRFGKPSCGARHSTRVAL